MKLLETRVPIGFLSLAKPIVNFTPSRVNVSLGEKLSITFWGSHTNDPIISESKLPDFPYSKILSRNVTVCCTWRDFVLYLKRFPENYLQCHCDATVVFINPKVHSYVCKKVMELKYGHKKAG